MEWMKSKPVGSVVADILRVALVSGTVKICNYRFWAFALGYVKFSHKPFLQRGRSEP